MRAIVHLLALAAVATTACSADLGWQGTIDERDGVAYVANPRDGMWQDREPVPIRFVLEQTFGADVEPRDAILGAIGWHGVAADGDGNVYLYDYSWAEIFAFAPDGQLRWRAGGPGQGPGEIFDAEGLAWDGEGGIWLSNAHLKRLDQWSTDGEFIGAYALADRGLPSGTLLGFPAPRMAVVQDRLGSRRPGAQAGGVIGIIDLSTSPWSSAADVEVDVADQTLQFSGMKTEMAVGEGVVTVGDFDSYELRLFDDGGNLMRVVSRDLPQMVGFPVNDERSLPYSSLGAPLRLAGGEWLVMAAWVDVDDAASDWRGRDTETRRRESQPWHSSIDVFDDAGRLLYSFERDQGTPEIGLPALVGPDGKLYTKVNDPYPQVRRYRVEIDR